jgi:glutaredoxin
MKIKAFALSLAAALTLLIPTANTKAQLPLFNTKNQSNLLAANPVYQVKNNSGQAEVALAKHLNKINAKMYGAFWCPHCGEQKELFGKQAVVYIKYIECDSNGTNPRPDLCKKAGVRAYPTWEINGKKYEGTRTLINLANLSGYKGRRDFKN